MSATIPIDFLLRVLQATPEQRAAIERILDGDDLGPAATGVTEPAARYVFRRAGSCWEVVFEGRPGFYLKDNVGARYLNYLLHHPNEVISAFDLEVAIQPEKAKARARHSIQPTLDPQAVRSCLRELTQLRSEREVAEAEGNDVEQRRLEEEIEAIELALTQRGQGGDAGERARNSVRKGIGGVVRQLQQGDSHARAFGAHLHQCVHLGYEVQYTHPNGSNWH